MTDTVTTSLFFDHSSEFIISMNRLEPHATPQLLFIVTEDWYFVSHRLHLAVAAKKAGFHVALAANIYRHQPQIEQNGIDIYEWQISRKSRHVKKEFQSIKRLIDICQAFKPDIIHNVALKPVIYGALVARITGVKRIVQALGGLGYIFSSQTLSAKILRPIIKLFYSAALSGNQTRLILQNPDDCRTIINDSLIAPERIRLVRGAGVNTDKFLPLAEKDGVPVVMLPARLIWEKGIREFVEVARDFKNNAIRARFVLVGDPDQHNPAAVPIEQIRSWCEEGIIEWWGGRDDMPSVIPQSNVVCLPSSYGEGLPKSLLEAASCARPIVTYNVPGCREIVQHGRNGLLVPPKNIAMLSQAVQSLIGDPETRRRMGANGREMVLRSFSQELVAKQTLEIYQELLA